MVHIDNYIGYVSRRGCPPSSASTSTPGSLADAARVPLWRGHCRAGPVPDRQLWDYALEQLGLLIDALKQRSARFTTARALAQDVGMICDLGCGMCDAG